MYHGRAGKQSNNGEDVQGCLGFSYFPASDASEEIGQKLGVLVREVGEKAWWLAKIGPLDPMAMAIADKNNDVDSVLVDLLHKAHLRTSFVGVFLVDTLS